jgi:hypothetical protein
MLVLGVGLAVGTALGVALGPLLTDAPGDPASGGRRPPDQ